ncbi:hypothetical protein SynA1825c_00113 [Synechococcus sp. A18-25c]|uniref:hypothetical protein n=1 Tax=Synechococcus sp. A18-25c TaxID=1866938 RepID=UPI0016493AC4|nr:hypothetical protein [Synechococcus sp. A18-25c]QNJ18456.1 hypothetical protein SynA1825c_00113 [Synechococcus sp. A18-25c]
MTLRLGILRFVRSLSADRSERRRLGAAVVRLLRQRRRSLAALSPLLRVAPTGGKAKLQLWQHLARSSAANRWPSPEAPSEVAAAIRSTQAYADAVTALSRDRNGFLQRGPDYGQLRKRWGEQTPERLLVFHHYDRRGLLPQSWCEALLVLQSAGWQVLLSSSHLDPVLRAKLAPAGVQIVGRANIGLCLGAYRDLALLLQSTPAAHQQLQALVLCNDSNLLVQPPDALVAQLERWTTQNAVPRPVLAGLTDSAQRNCYHLQSFLLHANRALLQHPAWLRFWLHYAISGSKDDLINQGEIGLSQALLAAGVELQPAYPLVQGLLTDAAMATELQAYGIDQPEHVNQSLFAWRSLLARGFPMVKKHVLFQLAEHRGRPMAIAELARWIPPERRDQLARDIEQLLISRYSGGAPRMG